MQIHIITIFPRMFQSVFAESIINRVQMKGIAQIQVHNLRIFTNDKRQTVDDRPFGGGPGMVMLVEPIYRAVEDIKNKFSLKDPLIILTSPKGEQFTHNKALEFSKREELIIICGHYEGVDERVAKNIAAAEITLGPYVLTGGELPAMVISDAVVRLLAGALGNIDSLEQESFSDQDKTEYPQYTRPAVFVNDQGEKWGVPEVLLGGDHRQINEWRTRQRKKPNP